MCFLRAANGSDQIRSVNLWMRMHMIKIMLTVANYVLGMRVCAFRWSNKQ